MATDPFAKVMPGQTLQIPAAAYNAFVDAARSHRGNQTDATSDPIREPGRAGLVPTRNDSGALVPRFGILGVDSPLFTPSDALDAFKRRVTLAGSTPADASHTGRFVIALEPIAPGALGMACASGLCAVQVDFPPDDGRERRFVDIADGVTGNLKAGDSGAATILWREAGTGVRWAIVRLGGFTAQSFFPIKLTLAGGAQGNALAPATWTYDVAGAITDESLAVGVDPTATPSNWRRPGVGQVSAATFGSAHYDANGALALDWINETPEPHAAFPIILSQSGGMQGTTNMPASWRYTITDAISGITLSTNTDPTAFPHEWRRPEAGKVTAATFGYASLSAGGVLTIGWINEVPEVPAVHVFPVNLVLAELASGGPDFPTNHMYNVFDASTGEDLGQFVNPGAPPHQWKRPDIGRYAPATFGLAYFNATDTLIITWINEVPELEACAASMGA